ncbi:ABC transporter ATP-binding protein [Rhodococcus koreensis]
MTNISVQGLSIIATATNAPILSEVDLELTAGRVLGLVGESGSGKSTLGLAMLGYARPGTRITAGKIHVAGLDVLELDSRELRGVRGRKIAYVPQDPGTALNPALSNRVQLLEAVDREPDSLERVRGILREVGLPDDDAFLARRPRELSGGQQQRIGIAMAMVANPAVVVLDEPTTGLDVTTQRMVLDLVSRLTRTHDMSAVYISHDLGVIAHVADDVAVMKDGAIVEHGDADVVMTAPEHRYTRRLIAAIPTLRSYRDRVPTAAGSEDSKVFRVRGLTASYGRVEVLHGVDVDVASGECVAVVGESGSGKSTMSRCLIGLHTDLRGTIELGGEQLRPRARRRTSKQQRRIQYIFQNPYASLHPRRTVGASIELAVRHFGLASRGEAPGVVERTLERVELTPAFAHRFPSELSGGQRQRVAIARALAVQPEMLICDEITSALDVSVQASILELLDGLRNDGLGMLFITHNLAVVSAIADRVIVLQRGAVVEAGSTRSVLEQPTAPYTSELLENTLDLADVHVVRR